MRRSVLAAGSPTAEDIRSYLDSAVPNLRIQTSQACTEFSPLLDDLKSVLPADSWGRYCVEVFQAHPVATLFHEDPFTHHSFTQPRGYPGDADLLDYVYGKKSVDNCSPTGRAVHHYATNVQACVAVRERREIVANLIDQTAISYKDARVLSIAAGHLREADISSAISGRSLGELIAFDQDETSLATIAACYGNGRITPHHGSVRSLLSGRTRFSDLNFVYASGLFDYLPAKTAARLTSIMFEMLAPGGTILVANFAPTLRDIGYMEAYMRWNLIYRNESDMLNLCNEINPSTVTQRKIYWDSNQCMLFLELERS